MRQPLAAALLTTALLASPASADVCYESGNGLRLTLAPVPAGAHWMVAGTAQEHATGLRRPLSGSAYQDPDGAIVMALAIFRTPGANAVTTFDMTLEPPAYTTGSLSAFEPLPGTWVGELKSYRLELCP